VGLSRINFPLSFFNLLHTGMVLFKFLMLFFPIVVIRASILYAFSQNNMDIDLYSTEPFHKQKTASWLYGHYFSYIRAIDHYSGFISTITNILKHLCENDKCLLSCENDLWDSINRITRTAPPEHYFGNKTVLSAQKISSFFLKWEEELSKFKRAYNWMQVEIQKYKSAFCVCNGNYDYFFEIRMAC